MITLERQSSLSREISQADTRAAIGAAMSKLSAHFGFQYFTLLKAPTATDILMEPLIVETTMPRGCIREIDAQRLFSNCPLLPLLQKMALPFCWSCDPRYEEGWLVNFPPELSEILGRYGIQTGVIMPLYSSDGSVFAMRLDGDRPLMTLPQLNEVGMLFLQSFRIFDRLRQGDPMERGVLTVRELEVLRWTSQGKTSSEIADILSLSDHTINAYLHKAIKKLDCVNRTQLVAKAIRLKLIS